MGSSRSVKSTHKEIFLVRNCRWQGTDNELDFEGYKQKKTIKAQGL